MKIIKCLTPHIVAVITFIVVAAAYFAPQYEGKDVRQHDDIQATGMKGGIPEHVAKYGEHPQWAPNMFSGMPAYLIDMNYDGRLLKEASSIFYFMGRPAAYYFILMAGFYFMLLCFGVNPWLSIIGGLIYGLSTYFFIIFEAGHITKLMALSFISPLIGAIFLTYTRQLWLGAALAGVFASIEISTSHPQIPYYFMFVIIAIFIAQCYTYVKNKQLPEFIKRSVILIAVAILAIGSNVVQLWYIQDYAKDSVRGKSELTKSDEHKENQTSGLDKDYITAWSYEKLETFNLFIPNLFGGSSSGGFAKDGEVAESLKKYNASEIAAQLPGYWGAQPFTSGPVYIGAVAIFLFFLGLFMLRGPIRVWLITVTVLSILLAWGKNFMWFSDLFIDYFPGYNKFRVVSMILVIVEWSVPLMGLLALNELWNKNVSKERFIKSLKYAGIVSGGIAVLFILFGSTLLNFSSESDYAMKLPDDVLAAMSSERASLMRADALRSLIFCAITAGAVWMFYNEKLKKGLFVGVISLLVLSDMVPVNKRFLNNDDFIPVRKAKEITPTAADKQILQDEALSYRVANLSVNPFTDATTSYFHKSIGGYHAAKLGRYQEVIDKYLSKMDMDVYNMLNTKYFIQQNKEDGNLSVMINPDAFGNGWMVENVDIVDSADDEYNMLGEVDLRNTAVVNKKYEQFLSGITLTNNIDSISSVTLVDAKANELVYKTESSVPALAVFSEIFYAKGWSAWVDSNPVEIVCADYILRGVVVPAGEHTVEFKFSAPHFTTLVAITYACSSILILMLIGSILIYYRKK